MRLELIDFNEEFDETKVLDNPVPLENKKFSSGGVYSEEIFGNYHEESQQDNLTRGWIDFGENYIINPILFPFVKKVFTNSKLTRILKAEKRTDLDGNILDSTNELDNIGLKKLYEDFFLYLGKYGDTSCDEYKFLIKNYDVLFINKLPVFNSKLRAGMLTGNNTIVGSSQELNSYYGFVIKYSNELKKTYADIEGDMQINILLYGLQDYANRIFKEIINKFLRRKEGWIRNNVFSVRINNSARNIIIPLVGYNINEVMMPYKTYLELYKKPLINMISEVKGISLLKASYFWRESTLKFNSEMYSYMKELNEKTKGGQYILLNRNPSIAIGSILELKICGIKTDYEDLGLSISNNILECLAGDYDGDTLNIIALFTTEEVEAFKCFSPSRLLISSNDGQFDSRFFLAKEQKLGIYVLNN